MIVGNMALSYGMDSHISQQSKLFVSNNMMY